MKPRSNTGSLPRRAFLKASAAAVALAASPGCRRSSSPPAGGFVDPDFQSGHRLREPFTGVASQAQETDVLIVGGGIAGLAAARFLSRHPRLRLTLLELEPSLGGNAASGRSAVSSYPWGAHYVPLPGRESPEILQFFREVGIITGADAQGRPVYQEEFLCHDPNERLFLHGRWQEGLIPQLGVSAPGLAETERFLDRMQRLRESVGSDGLPLFAIPLDRSSADPAWRALDRLTFAAWLDAEDFRAPHLRWYLDYCCRDDFGLPAAGVSAWAGLHYFAARGGEAANAGPSSVVTWPSGNGWLVERLRDGIRADIQSGLLVREVRPVADRVQVQALSAGSGQAGMVWSARRVILAVPQFVAGRLLGPPQLDRGRSAVHPPWLVANLHVDALPVGRGVPPAWDNVLYQGRGLGYVLASHQRLDRTAGGTVLTYYLPLDHAAPDAARREAFSWSFTEASDLVLGDLRRAHPDIGRHVQRLEIRRWGHGMVCPVPGLLWNGGRQPWARPVGPIHFAHSDLSGISLFEEAFIQGVRAGQEVQEALAT